MSRGWVIFGLVVAIAIWLVPPVSDLAIDRLDAVELIALGLAVGTYGTIVGVGGGFLLVPLLLIVWRLPPAQAAGTSLVVVFLNATAGSLAYARERRIDVRSGLWFAAATLPGAVAGAFLAQDLSGVTFARTFGTLLLLVALMLIWKPLRAAETTGTPPRSGTPRQLTDRAGTTFRWSYSMPLALAISFGIGFLSSALGIGGGVIQVPAMIHLLAFPTVIATATSQFVLIFTALVGGGTHLALGNVLFGPATLLGIGVIAGARIGSAIARRIHAAAVVRLLAVALLLVAVRLWFGGR